MEYKMEYRLTDLCELIMGQSPDSSSCNKDGKGIPFYQGNADFGEKNPTPRNWCLQPKKIAQKDDILISVRAPIGDLNIANEDCCIGRGVAAIRMKSKECDRDYLYLFLESKSKYLQDCGTGSTFTAINKGVLESLKVKCPELKNQTSIANEIENIKAAIKYKNSELICLNEAVQSEFVEMFGENPVESGKWKVAKWADKVRITNGRDYKKLVVKTGLYPVYGSGGDMGIRVDDYLCSENTVIIGRKGNIDKPIFVKEKFWNVDTAFGLNVDESEINPYYFFEHSKKYNYRSMDTGVTIPSLTKTALFELKLAIPPLDLQNQFAAFVQQIDKSKFVLQQQLQFIKKYDIMTSRRKICFYTTAAT